MPNTSTKKRVKDGLLITVGEDRSIIPASDTSLDIYRPDDRDLRILMDRAVTEDDWVDIFSKAREMALSGGQVGIKAMDFLAKYRFGLPAQMTRPENEGVKQITVVEVIRAQGSPKTELKDEPLSEPPKKVEEAPSDVPF